jgi:hypothetical protein
MPTMPTIVAIRRAGDASSGGGGRAIVPPPYFWPTPTGARHTLQAAYGF